LQAIQYFILSAIINLTLSPRQSHLLGFHHLSILLAQYKGHMKKSAWFCIGLLGLIFTLAACMSKQKTSTISEMLTQQLASNDESVRYTALLLLSNTVLSEKTYQKLIRYAEEEENPVLKLCGFYVLARRSQESRFIEAFVTHYPEGEAQKQILAYHRKGRYISDMTASSPLRDYLAYIANNDDSALEKLISGYNASDGADQEELNQQIAAVYRFKPQLVRSLLVKYQIDVQQVIRELKE
jgi:hypothetical protein